MVTSDDPRIRFGGEALYEQAKANNPGRWSGPTRNCEPPANEERTLTKSA